MKSYIEEFNAHLISRAETAFLPSVLEQFELDYAALESLIDKRLGVILDEAHQPMNAAYKFGLRKPILSPPTSVAHALSGYLWTFPPIKETHRAAYDAIHAVHATLKSDAIYFDTLTAFVSMGARTGRWSSTKPNQSAQPSTAVYIGSRGNGKTFAQQHFVEHHLKRHYVLKPNQREMLEELRALHRKGWRI